MTGTHPDAIEAWAFDADTFEHLLERLEPYQRVVILSGDVHYSAGTAMSYWRGAAAQPARIVQFTSSGLKNVMPTMIIAVDRSAGFAQQMIRANLGTERIGWERPQDDVVLLPPGRTPVDLVPAMRSRLVSTPVTIPTWGWPDDNDPDPTVPFDPAKATQLNPATPPDWRWRVTPLLDDRADADRPEPIRPLDIDDDQIDADLADPATLVERLPGDRRPPPARPRPPPQRPPDPVPQQLRAVSLQRVRGRPARGGPRGLHGVRRPGRPGRRRAQGRRPTCSRWPRSDRTTKRRPFRLRRLAIEVPRE